MSDLPDYPKELMHLLDAGVPPNSAMMGNPNADPLVELAQRLADLPKTSLSEAAVIGIETQLRQTAITLGPPRFLNPVRIALISIVAVSIAIWVGIIVLFDGDDNLPTIGMTSPATFTHTASATTTFTPVPSQSPTSLVPAAPITATMTPVGALVIEGPIQEINGSTIVIYGITIQLDPANPLTPVFQVNDMLRVEGEIDAMGNSIIVIAITVVLVDVEVYISDDGQIFRDDAACNTPPPVWAPANGWRARCEIPASAGDDNDDDDD